MAEVKEEVKQEIKEEVKEEVKQEIKEEVREEQQKQPSATEVIAKLKEILPTVDMAVTTEKMLRKSLEGHFGCELAQFKSEIKSEVKLLHPSWSSIGHPNSQPDMNCMHGQVQSFLDNHEEEKDEAEEAPEVAPKKK